ncbi:hypothetical protein, partial [Microbacterium sp. BF1]|uniref:hypothetical protein n=1 Tax=Microbacterium sp. BF1 TaxID=2821146 RepID=UPI001C4DF417
RMRTITSSRIDLFSGFIFCPPTSQARGLLSFSEVWKRMPSVVRALDALEGSWAIGDEAPVTGPIVRERITA